MWGGAALAAVVAEADFDGGLAGAIRAALRLPEEWRNPRMAWERASDQEALPGPALYWSATLIVALIALAAVMAGMRVWRANRDRGRVRLGVETRARFATGRDLAPLVVQRPVPSGRFVLGRVHGRLVATEDRRAADRLVDVEVRASAKAIAVRSR